MDYFNYSNRTITHLLQDATKVKVLSKAEEQELFRHVRGGNAKARQRLISANIRFVFKVALNHKHSPIPLPDLVNEGMLGLNRAVDDFEPKRGIRFISYAVWWIRSYITRAINQTGYGIRLPANVAVGIKTKYRNDPKAKSLLEELVEIGEHYKDEVVSTQSEEQGERQIMDKKAVDKLLVRLTPREADILRYVYGLHGFVKLNLRQIGERHNMSHERVRQIRDEALSRLSKSTAWERRKWV